MKSRLSTRWELFFLFVFAVPILVIGFSFGPDPGLTGAPFPPDNGNTCSECHGSAAANSGPGSVTITTPASYVGGSSNSISVRVSDPNQRRWGFELSARTAGGQQAGTLLPNDGTTQVKSLGGIQYIEHTNAPSTSVGAGFTFSFTWTAPNTSVGPVTFYVAGNAANGNGTADGGDRIYTSSRTIQPQAAGPTPSIFTNGTVNNASFAAGTNPIPAGTIAAIFGTDLNNGSENPDSAFDNNGKLLTTLGGASVTFNGTPAPIFSSFPGQLNVQVPDEVAGSSPASVVVTVDGRTSAASSVPIGASLPGIFTIPPGGTGQGAVQVANTAIFAAPQGSIPGREARPAARGEFITIFCTGLGAVSNPPGTGRPASGQPTVATPQVTIGGVPANVTFSGLAPGFVGLYQVNAEIPAGAPTGNAVPLVLTIGGVQSNSVTIAVSDGQSASSNPVPAISSLSPSSFDLDADSTTVTIVGSGFTQASTVTLNGVAKTATYVSASQLTVLVTFNDFPSEGEYPLVVTNPAPGGGSSSPYMFRARQPSAGGSDDY